MSTDDVRTERPGSGSRALQLWAMAGVALVVSALFLGLVWDFLIALFLAAIFSAMAGPLYRCIFRHFGHRRAPAVAATLIILICGVLVPLIVVVALSAEQAAGLTSSISTWIETLDARKIQAFIPDWLPFHLDIVNLGATIASKVGQVAGQATDLFVTAVSSATRVTAGFLLNLFVMLYAMVFFIPQQSNMFTQLLRHSGLPLKVQDKLAERVISISRATLKGTFIIGLVQGVLGGLGFWAAGLPGAAFWGCVMAVVSVIPGIGPSLVLIPGILVLIFSGQTLEAVGLTLWTVLVVTSVDNVLRPMLVGRDTRMPDILVLICTFGGLAMFGAVGLIIGPVIGGLMITVWSVFEDGLRDAGLSSTGIGMEPESHIEPATDDLDGSKTDTSDKIHALQEELRLLREELNGQQQAGTAGQTIREE